MKASVCMSTFNKPHLLPATLDSIFRQDVPFDFEVIVVDDGSADGQVHEVCSRYPVRYHRLERPAVFRNPCVARNAAYKMASGDVIIAQSDEVIHVTPNTIEILVQKLHPGHFVLANVFCHGSKTPDHPEGGYISGEYTGPGRKAPLFFLGSLLRSDLYAVGGNDEDFRDSPGREDVWFGYCLTRGLGLVPDYRTDVVGHHQWHDYHYASAPGPMENARTIFRQKFKRATKRRQPWISSGGPWPYHRGMAYNEGIFTGIYEKNTWGNEESASGDGSTHDATAEVRKQLPPIVKQYGVKTILDLACGDYNWMRLVDLNVDRYIGADVVRKVVEKNTEQFADDHHQFVHLDLLTATLPQVDLVLCRDCLVHYRYEDVFQVIRNLRWSGSKYLLATTFTREGRRNREATVGGWKPYNLCLPPFNFSEPLLVIDEQCKEAYPHCDDKSLALWKIEDLP